MVQGDEYMEDRSIKKLLTINVILLVLFLMIAACDGGQDGGDSTPEPTTPPPTSSPPPGDFQTNMLDLINEARAEARDCGDTFFPAAPPVNWDDRVEAAALAHSIDMAETGFFDHEGSDGSNTGDRLMNEGYDPSDWGETILVGLDKETKVIESFLKSPEHCEILMTPSFEDVGVGTAEGRFHGHSARYWTLDLATEKN